MHVPIGCRMFDRRKRVAFLLAVSILTIIPTSSVQGAAEAFDLVCTGTFDQTKQAWTGHLRIDLKNNEFCEDTCERVDPIHEVTPDMIELQGWNETQWILSRGTGDVSYMKIPMSPVTYPGLQQPMMSPGLPIHAHGSCTKSSFSGFPRKF